MNRKKIEPYFLLIFQIIAHLALIWLLFTGHWAQLGVSLIVYFFTGCVGMTVTFHRLLSHKSWDAPDWFRKFGTLCGFYGLTGSPLAWVAIHREHHRYTDKEGDPHSPQTVPWWRVQWLSMFEPVDIRYVVDLMRDPFQRFLHEWYFVIHACLLVGLLVIVGPVWAAALYLAPAAILWNAGSLINTLNHLTGYRDHNTRDQSTNNVLTGYLVWGEGWHNNHHAAPREPKFGHRWWEVDVGWWIIRTISR
jgi:stearoyl-CoA desaturase (delta-9 desaturase)